MAYRTVPQEGDIWAGVIGLRGPDGSVVKTIKFYTPAPDGEKVKPGQLTAGQKAVSDGIVRYLTMMYARHMESEV